jgi:hypothetical protein
MDICTKLLLGLHCTQRQTTRLRQTLPRLCLFPGAENQTTYVTDHRFLILGVVISLLGILPVMPIFWSLWKRGEKVSLSHVEIAKAFDAPLLASADCNGTAAQLLDQVGSKGVRYGRNLTTIQWRRKHRCSCQPSTAEACNV